MIPPSKNRLAVQPVCFPVKVTDGLREWVGASRDLSRSRIALLSAHALGPDEPVMVTLCVGDSEESWETVKGKVVGCEFRMGERESRWVLTIEFTALLSHQLFARVPWPVKRAHPRLAVALPLDIHAQRGSRLGITHDMSRGGAKFLTRSEFAVGERLELQFCSSSDTDAELGFLTSEPVTCTVLRVDHGSPDQFWPFSAAVRFESVLPMTREPGGNDLRAA